MRLLVWVTAIFALAAGLMVAARYSTGYALLVVPPYRVEVSLNLLVAAVVAAFALAYFVARMIAGAVRLPTRVREYRAARRRERAHAMLLEALHAYFAGRYAKAEQAAATSIELGEHAALGAVLAARAAHALRAFERRDGYLARAAALAGENDAVRIVTEAELLLDQRQAEAALERLRALPAKHTAALRLELRAQQLAKNWERVLALIDLLEKRAVFDAAQALQLRAYAHAENLRRKAADAAALKEAWQNVPARLKTDTRVASAAARAFLALGDCAKAHRIIEDSLEAAWDGGLAALYAECEGDFARRIERAESWLKRHPRDAALLLALGGLCAQQELWGKAQSYLEASLSVEPGYAAHLALARLNDRLGNAEAANRHYRASLELAVQQLRRQSSPHDREPPG